MARAVKASILLASGLAASAIKCPGSGAWLGHAKTQVVAEAAASCTEVQAEIAARADGKNGWVDPHNGGHYMTIGQVAASDLETQRSTNPKHSPGGITYTDKQTFTFTQGANTCKIEACSESQGSSLKDSSTNYCDIRNLYCGSADGCKPALHDFTSTQVSVDASSGQSDFSKCIVKPAASFLAESSQAGSMKCPGSSAWLGHAKTQVTATATASCADVKAEVLARIGGQKSWVDPHNGGIYKEISASDAEVESSRSTNPKHSVGGMTYTDKQIFTLTQDGDKCTIQACSESQGASLKDFSTNYCDVRNLYCGSADGCKPVVHDFTSTQTSVDASSDQSDFSACIVKPSAVIEV